MKTHVKQTVVSCFAVLRHLLNNAFSSILSRYDRCARAVQCHADWSCSLPSPVLFYSAHCQSSTVRPHDRHTYQFSLAPGSSAVIYCASMARRLSILPVWFAFSCCRHFICRSSTWYILRTERLLEIGRGSPQRGP